MAVSRFTLAINSFKILLTFLGTQPTLTHVPPSRPGSMSPTLGFVTFFQYNPPSIIVNSLDTVVVLHFT
jgi:hypothetical protein